MVQFPRPALRAGPTRVALHIGTAVVSAFLLAAAPLGAQTLTIGMAGSITSVDPHFYNASPNNSVAMQLFDRLIERAAGGTLTPGLAESWRPVSDTVWEFKLRAGVTWHDGRPFTADDAVFSLTRARNVPNSPGGFGGFLRSITRATAVDATTLQLETRGPAPGLPGDLVNVAIISRHAGEGASTADYNAGRAAIGTGAFRLRAFTPGDRVEMVRNPTWWGDSVAWETATYRMMPNAAGRTAALLSRDVDLIEMPSASDLPRLRASNEVTVAEAPGLRVIYLVPYQHAAVPAPHIAAANGTALAANPLTDRRVRQALSIAINRAGLVERIMEGTAVATQQIVPAGTFSALPDLPVATAQPAQARDLLRQAGYPNGFQMTLHVPADRYPYAPNMAQAVAQMWARIGLRVNVVSMPWSTFSTQRDDFAMHVVGLGNATFDATSMLVNVLGTPNPVRNTGSSNKSGYSNPEVDRLVEQASSTFDPAAREALLQQASRIALDDAAIIPVYHQTNLWAFRNQLSYEPRLDERTLAKAVQQRAR